MLASFLQYLAPLRGVVDRVAVNGYYLADPNGSDVAQSGGVVRLGEDLPAIVAALQQAGFEVEPLVGNGPPMRYPPPGSLPQQVGSSIDRFRPYLRPALRASVSCFWLPQGLKGMVLPTVWGQLTTLGANSVEHGEHIGSPQ